MEERTTLGSNFKWRVLSFLFLALLALSGCQSHPKIATTQGVDQTAEDWPRIPPADAASAEVPAGYRAEIIATGLTYPTSIEFDDEGNMFIAEAGFIFGDQSAPARIMRIDGLGRIEIVADQLNAPVTDLLWYRGRLFISHCGKVSVLTDKGVTDIVRGLPSFGDYQNNQLTAGPDGKLYLGQGTASNSGVVGADNFAYGWLPRHPEVHDYPARPLEIAEGIRFRSVNPLRLSRPSEPSVVETGPFQSFGKWGATSIGGTVKANGTILRFNPDGSDLEMYAWGLRNPFGIVWGADGILYATENGYDERGSRPIANAPDSVWQIKYHAWYGFPDFASGLPVTDLRFRPASGEPVQFLLKVHPHKIDQPLARLPAHSGVAKLDYSRTSEFGYAGQLFIALAGDFQPITGNGPRAGYQVLRLDPLTGETSALLRTRAAALGPPGFEYVATSGPKRPIDVRFSPEGDALYVADLGAIGVKPSRTKTPHPFGGTGVIWRIRRENAVLKFPIGISFFPGKSNDAVGGVGAVVGTIAGEDAGLTKK